MIARYVRIDDINKFERAGWFWKWSAAHGGAMHGSHRVWSVVIVWLCECEIGGMK
jgi:hypothetical protein